MPQEQATRVNIGFSPLYIILIAIIVTIVVLIIRKRNSEIKKRKEREKIRLDFLNELSIEESLNCLTTHFENGNLTEEEYRALRAEIISKL